MQHPTLPFKLPQQNHPLGSWRKRPPQTSFLTSWRHQSSQQAVVRPAMQQKMNLKLNKILVRIPFVGEPLMPD
jgi:hypothetical protein